MSLQLDGELYFALIDSTATKYPAQHAEHKTPVIPARLTPNLRHSICAVENAVLSQSKIQFSLIQEIQEMQYKL